ncbi:glycosyltransferase [Dendrosporobacter sp. 1207_IL3150]|uniref:glycosyltransferase n=1 Tax=Dendrosporobacter sp. 1207_IL3150 TaxID=3084054 RepID=UPI002FD925E0
MPRSTIPLTTISLCMIVKNEEAVIGRCLESAKDIVDEFIIVDTGSTDKTKEIVKNYNTKIYDFEWINDFAAARNYAFSLATKDYILWLDADDVIMPDDKQKFLELKSALVPTVDAVNMFYNLTVNQSGQVSSRLRRNRLVKREKNFRWIGAVHEYIEVYGNIVSSDIAVTHSPVEHDANRNLLIYEKRQRNGEVFSPRDLYYYANELYDHQLYNRAIEFYQKFLATNQGWVEDNIGACGKLADCFYNLKDSENQLKYIYMSFKYGPPRAEFCCRLGYYHMNLNQLEQAIFWYKLATTLEKPNNSWGLINNDCWTWLPHIQLCVCYSRAGKNEIAREHNELAAQYIPDDPRIEYNRNYFKQVLS